MKIDLHMHTAEHSKCCQIPAAEMLRTARDRGLDGVVITDHHYHLTEPERAELEQAVPGICVFRGIEIGICESWGQGPAWEDLVIVSEHPWEGKDPVPSEDPAMLAEYARRTGALTILAHPFRYHRHLAFDLGLYAPDAVELASSNVGPCVFAEVAAMARKYDMKVVADTDAHSLNLVGLYYVELDKPVRTETDLARAIRAGDYCLGFHEPTLQARIDEVRPQEDLARRILAQGGTLENFHAQGGIHGCFFTRVAEGSTYLPDRRIKGLRNPVEPTTQPTDL
ncbi:MAG: PHP domain-containing protein [Planctomycetes bacterium]|nr:PHP domain-containing protein [Planctomycetota bacterium]